jgi:hypothetical protein
MLGKILFLMGDSLLGFWLAARPVYNRSSTKSLKSYSYMQAGFYGIK